MKLAFLLMIAVAAPLLMVTPQTCQGGGCEVYPNGHCVYEYNFSCGTIKNPGKCFSTQIDADTWRCACGPMDGVQAPTHGKKR